MKHLLLPIFFMLLISCSKDDGNSENNNPSTKVSLPVKVTRKNASGDMVSESTYTYDSQKRRKTTRLVDMNISYTSTYSYENGKITQIIDHDDASKPLEKLVFYYNSGGMIKEEVYYNDVLAFNYEWYHRPDGGKERRIKNTTGELVQTWYYRLSSTGNIERVLVDNVNATIQDEEYIFSGFDNKQRVVNSYVNNVIYIVLTEVEGTKINVPNNNTTLTHKQLGTGDLIAGVKMEYTYNTKGQVTQTKIFRVSSNVLAYTDTIEYQEF